MSRYSKFPRAWWQDPTFRGLSDAGPCAKLLYLRLVTGPENTALPGLFSAWAAGLAESLRWPLEGFREAFGELFAKGFAEADWDLGIVWLPRAVEINRPDNPNVIKGWRTTWDEIPDCPLKSKAFLRLRAAIAPMGPAFAKAFADIAEPSSQPFPNGMANQDQDQEQEQEQEQESLALPRVDFQHKPTKAKKTPKPKPEILGHADVIACFVEEYEKLRHEKPIIDGPKDGKAAKALLQKTGSADAAVTVIRRAFAEDNLVRTTKPDLTYIASNVNAYRGTAPAKTNGRAPVQPSQGERAFTVGRQPAPDVVVVTAPVSVANGGSR